jgi:hypothetical protein
MRWMRTWTVGAGVALAGCAGSGEEPFDPDRVPGPEAEVEAAGQVAALPMTAADSAEARARIEAVGDSLRALFEAADVLTAREVALLRLDRNAAQVAAARRLGTRASGQGEVQRLLAEGRLVALEDSTEHWILRRMENALPYATPDLEAMLVALGERFHARLDSVGLPRYRFRVTSVLRTPEMQAELRRTNANAAWTVSAHEFGTTADLSHERFAVPAAGVLGLGEMEVEMLEEVGREHARVLQAELGRAIRDLREQGALLVMMEDAQPVYHMTVARRFVEEG